jgi:formamidopyrimidine-DNA glycosylase
MPELPEVETMRRDLDQRLRGRVIDRIHVRDERVIHPLSRHRFIEALQSARIEAVDRRGKALILKLDTGTHWVVQVKMTGFMRLLDGCPSEWDRDVKVIAFLGDGGVLAYHDQRLLGWLHTVDDLMDIPLFQSLGPEPFASEVTVDWFQKRTGAHPRASRKRSIAIKTLLLDQTFLAGIGNIYASEILFAARIDPFTPAHRITDDQAARIIAESRRILDLAIRHRGTSMRNYRDSDGKKGAFMGLIQVYGKAGEPCPVCAVSVKRAVQNARSTFYCPRCQSVAREGAQHPRKRATA